MKICDLTQSYTHTSGGIKTYLEEKRNQILRNSDFKHVLIIPGEEDRVDVGKNCITYSIKAKKIPGCEPYRFIFRLDKVLSILKKESPDIIELGSPYWLPYAGFNYRKKNKCPVVGFYHTDFPEAYIEPAMKKTILKPIAKFGRSASEQYARFIYNRCDSVLSSTPLMIKKLETLNINNVMNLPLGVDIEVFHPKQRDQKFRESLGVREGELLLVYTGRFDIEKRLNILLEAFNKIKNRISSKLLLVGHGPLKEFAEKKAQEKGEIKILPYESDRNKLAKYLASSDIYLTCGPHETFGLSIIEAQSCGLPVIGVRSGALIDRVNDSVGILARPDDSGDFAEKTIRFVQEDYKQKGRNARELIVKQFSWQETFNKLFNLYEKLIRDFKKSS